MSDAVGKPYYLVTCDRFLRSHKAPRGRCRDCDREVAIQLLRELVVDIEPDAMQDSRARQAAKSFLENYDAAMNGVKKNDDAASQ